MLFIIGIFVGWALTTCYFHGLEEQKTEEQLNENKNKLGARNN